MQGGEQVTAIPFAYKINKAVQNIKIGDRVKKVADIHTSAGRKQIKAHGTYDIGGKSLGRFMGFEDIMTVSTHEEAIWAAPIAKNTNKVLVRGETTFAAQEDAWMELGRLGVDFEYAIIVNPDDLNTTSLACSPGYDTFDDQFHIPALSAVTAEIAAYRDAYVITEYEPSTHDIGDMDHDLNSRAIGYYLALRNATERFGIPRNVALVGSASAVPQFQLPDQTNSDPENVEGDLLVNCDVIYGFLGDDQYYMDSAVGRFVNLNVQGMSNQVVRTFMFDRFDTNVDDELLRKISRETGGRYYRARDVMTMERIYREIDDKKLTELSRAGHGKYHELAPLFILSALGLYFIEMVLKNTIFLKIP